MSTDALRDRLKAHDGKFAPSWNPDVGDIVCGKITGFSKANTKFGESLICTIEDPELGEQAVWLSSTVLLDHFKRLKPKIGEHIGVKYLGKHEEKGYHKYFVTIDRPDQGGVIDWENVKAAPDASAVADQDAPPAETDEEWAPPTDDEDPDPFEGE